MKISLLELIQRSVKDGVKVQHTIGNQGLWEVGARNEKKPPFIKIAVTDKMAEMMLEESGVMVMMIFPKDYIMELDQEQPGDEVTP